MTISMVGEVHNLSLDTLRYYERIGLIHPIERNASGIRNYSESDSIWIHFIKCMRTAGVEIEALTEYCKLYHQEGDTRARRKEILLSQKEKLEKKRDELSSTIETLSKKIQNYDTSLLKAEQKLDSA